MPTHRVAPMLALLLALFAGPAWAFLDPPYITPVHPVVGDTIFVNVHGGECDLLNIGVVPPVISQEGNAITIVFTGTHEGAPEFCIYGIGTTTYPSIRILPGPTRSKWTGATSASAPFGSKKRLASFRLPSQGARHRKRLCPLRCWVFPA